VTELLTFAAAGAMLAWAAPRARARLLLSKAKHRSLAGHSRWSRRIAALLPYYSYDDATFLAADSAPGDVVAARRDGLRRLSAHFAERCPATLAATAALRPFVPDLDFTNTYRVPFQFREVLDRTLRLGAFAVASDGLRLRDLDGNESWDLGGAYGVNVFGYEFYKACIAAGVVRAEALGPVLGPYHPLVSSNVARLCEISGFDAVSFHMSGTEAVMQAVRLARYHTGRTHLVRFCGAYHGWWGDVQPGIGNPVDAPHTYTLAEMSAATLRVLESRRDIACVLVNPLQALHPNAAAPGDGSLLDGSRRAHFDRAAYSAWLEKLREVCDRRGIVLIFDEVFMGFRLAPGGAQAYFGVKADIVTYGKTVAGGLPIGVVCGRRDLMKRYRDDRPADICFARGTFNAHPHVMATMAEFLERILDPAVAAVYHGLDERWDARVSAVNARLSARELPVRVANLSSVWTVAYTRPSAYNWMFQFYLRAAGLSLSWVGTGRFIFPIDVADADFAAIADRIVEAASAMEADGWWWVPEGADNRTVKRRVLRETLRVRLGLPARPA
jgi:glutamate-1-semialdehyde 2,1-aminomutase